MGIMGHVKVVLTLDPETGQLCADLQYTDADGNVLFDSGPVCFEGGRGQVSYGPVGCGCELSAQFECEPCEGGHAPHKEQPQKEEPQKEQPKPPPHPGPRPGPRPPQPARK